MAKLYFYHGAMNSGKSTALLQVAHNYQERGMRVVIVKPKVDTKAPTVLSRLNVEGQVDWAVGAEDSILDAFHQDQGPAVQSISCILVDEAQFLTAAQVDELFYLVVAMNVPVMAYGLRSDFRTHAFTGSQRLLELAHSMVELKTICACGAKAMFNARKINGKFTAEGEVVAIDGQQATYESLCGQCYFEQVGSPAAKTLG